jgi:hypothetical protein
METRQEFRVHEFGWLLIPKRNKVTLMKFASRKPAQLAHFERSLASHDLGTHNSPIDCKIGPIAIGKRINLSNLACFYFKSVVGRKGYSIYYDYTNSGV